MLIFTDNVNIFCYLFNPKCGTFTFNNVIIPQIKAKYKVLYHAKNSLEEGYSYNSFQYYHCNLEGAVNYMEKNNIVPSKVIFFTTIRDPLERYISAYNYTLNFEKMTKLYPDSKNTNEDFKNYIINDKHFINFIPSKFRFYKKYSINNVIKLENLKNDLDSFFKKYKLNIDCTKISSTKLNTSTNKEEIHFSLKTTKLIKENFKEDYVSGKYYL
jgi:hypothetical protein